MKKAAVLLLAICMFSSALSLAVPVRGLNVSSCALKARDSSEYSPGTAWDMGYKGDGVNIAILDTGVDDGHESLDGRFVAGVDLSKGDYEIEGNPDDTNGHGTHCAGIALGDGGGDGVFAGAAPEAGLLDVKIASALGFGATMDGIEWCEQKKDLYNIRVLSISYGDFGDTDEDGSDSNCRKANAAVEAGLILVVSAGNDGPDNRGMGGLAAADRTICVAAVDDMETVEREDDVMATFSSRGPRMDDGDDDLYDELKPDVSAPGVDISAPDFSITGQHALGYVSHSGTSMACPHVAGVVALMLGANPSLTPEEVKEILHITAEPRGQPGYPQYPYPHNKWNREYGYGIVDAHGAV
ncbi:MAG: S8 family serine peptidase, partial [Thermoplasmata archaeon]|nr:S8 family serine peptidase [Thermoplasmata archaeon]